MLARYEAPGEDNGDMCDAPSGIGAVSLANDPQGADQPVGDPSLEGIAKDAFTELAIKFFRIPLPFGIEAEWVYTVIHDLIPIDSPADVAIEWAKSMAREERLEQQVKLAIRNIRIAGEEAFRDAVRSQQSVRGEMSPIQERGPQVLAPSYEARWW
jgi:hypothetical protein